MDQLKFHLDHFEGPLDLLLTLVRKNKVSIYDIPISMILDQYLAVMQEMQEMDLEISSEFLVLAATLLQIKSKMLLPKAEDEEDDGVDPREELARRLAEYSKVKNAAAVLTQRQNIGASLFFKVPDVIERPPAEWNYASLTPENLLLAYQRAYQKLERKQPPPKHSFVGIVGHEKVSVRKKVASIWKTILGRSRILFRDLFHGTTSRPEAVASFLAVLELIKLKKIRVEYGEDADFSNPSIFPMDDNPDMEFNEIED